MDTVTYRKRSRDRIKTNVNLVHEIRRIANAHKRASTIHVVLPRIQFFVALKSQVHAAIFGLKEQTVWFEISPFDIRYVL